MKAKNDDACLVEPKVNLTKENRKQKIRDLNDILRKSGCGGKTLIADGIVTRGPDFAQAVLKAVQTFNAFSDANDPWGEHDFGSLMVQHQRINWKIDYYNKTATGHSSDPASNTLTLRVLTIMLAEEY